MSTETNKAIVHRYVEDGANAGNMNVIDELFADDLINHEPTQTTTRDLVTLKQFILARQAVSKRQAAERLYVLEVGSGSLFMENAAGSVGL